ncbi:histone deacetylase [Verrucomicrobiota bacterium]|nr:histone deacetylase [Verrucomicrobiota bacterium]
MPVTALYYSDKFVLAKKSFDTTRKAAWIADSLTTRPMPNVRIVPPSPVTEAEVLRVHSPAYLEALRTGEPLATATSSTLAWDSGTLTMGLNVCGGVMEAGKAALRDGVGGTLASGLHHAKRDRGAGFCTLNGLAIAAHTLADATNGHILILDLDAHCGGGTHSLIQGHPRLWQMDVSVSAYDDYQPGKRCVKEIVTKAPEYLKTVGRCLQWAEAEWPEFALCLYNAGMDVHQIGGLRGMDDFLITLREEMVFQWCRERGIPVAYAMAGGYTGGKMTRKRLVDLHRLTIAAASIAVRSAEKLVACPLQNKPQQLARKL